MRSLLWLYLVSRRFPREMSTFEVRRFFTLSGDDRHLLGAPISRPVAAGCGASTWIRADDGHDLACLRLCAARRA
jgi:hypothetical protein